MLIGPLEPEELPGDDVPLLLPPGLPLAPLLLPPGVDVPGLEEPCTVLPGTEDPPLVPPLEPGDDAPGEDVPGEEAPAFALLVPLVPVPLLPLCPLVDVALTFLGGLGFFGGFGFFAFFASAPRGANPAASIVNAAASRMRRRRESADGLLSSVRSIARPLSFRSC